MIEGIDYLGAMYRGDPADLVDASSIGFRLEAGAFERFASSVAGGLVGQVFELVAGDARATYRIVKATLDVAGGSLDVEAERVEP